MRYDLYKGATFVASYDFDGEPEELHPNKGRLLKHDPPSFDAATQRLQQVPVTEETTGALDWEVVDLTQEEIELAHPRVHLSGWQACTAIIGTIGTTRFATMYSDPALLLLRVRIDTCRDVDPADMPDVFAFIASVDPDYITPEEASAIMAAWPRA
jgi:hypothetical protein